MSESCKDRLDLLIRSRTPIICIRSTEEEKIEKLLEEACKRLGRKSFLRWDFIQGLEGQPNNQGFAARNPAAALDYINNLPNEQPTIFLLLDFHQYCDDTSIIRQLRNLSRQLRQRSHTIIISAAEWQLPPELQEAIAILDLSLPNEKEIRQLLESIANASGKPLDELTAKQLSQSCLGLKEQRIRKIAAAALVCHGCLSLKDLDNILEEKRQAIANNELLEYYLTDSTIDDLRGLEYLKTWLNNRRLAFTNEGQLYGLPLPRGVLLVGPQGTGKSLMAKAIAYTWGMPLLRLDVGKLFAGLVGASEARTREMIRIAEAMAPCVLWIDEIDKGLNGNYSSDSGTSQRVLASFLTWMAEKKSAVFVVATANSVEPLPPELIRKGRFDEIFLLDLPGYTERRDILELHINRRRPNLHIELGIVLDRTMNFSGAELEQTVIEAMHLGFSQGRDLNETDLIRAAGSIIPLATTAYERMKTLRAWTSTGRIRPASRMSLNMADT